MMLFLLTPFGCILWGVGAYNGIHWFGLVFAMGTVSFVTTSGSQIWITYCIDSYHDLGAEALVTVMILRNTLFFAVNYGWVTQTLLIHARNISANISPVLLHGCPIWAPKTDLLLQQRQASLTL